MAGSIDQAVSRRHRGRTARSRRRGVVLVSVLTLIVSGGLFAWWKVRSWLRVPDRYKAVVYSVPDAPRLAAGSGETIYRIDPTRSQLRYEVSEKIVGATAGRASGTTNGLAGDIAVNTSRPGTSRVGDIVANVEQFHSDEALRDARIRKDFLESHTHPLAIFHTTSLRGLPASIEEGRTYAFELAGTATVKGTTVAVVWRTQAKVADGELSATATTRTRLSAFHAGPISIAGLVSTSDDVTLTFRLTAVDPSKRPVPTQIAAPAGVKGHGKSPSFRKMIQPILAASCASCHNSGQVGADTWKLDTAADASRSAPGIATVTRARYMPPWPASPLGVPLLHPLSLPQKQIDALVAWGKAGGKLDVAPSTRIAPARSSGTAQPRSDLVLTMPRPYQGSAAVPNDYRCFVLDPRLSQPMFLTGYAFRGDQIPEIHHAQVFQVPADQRAEVATADGKDGKPGWSCYAGPGVSMRPRSTTALAGSGHRRRGFTGQAGLIAGWVPGQTPVIYGHNTGVLLAPGDVLVLQIHYHHDNAAVTPDRSGISLQLDPVSPRYKPIEIINPIGPVEIPCMPGVKAPLCDRDAALAADLATYGPIGAYAEPGLLGLCGLTPEQLTAGFNGVSRTSCDYKVPESGTIIGAMGHMHTLGKSFRLTLDPGTAKERILLDIPTWNFDWQMNYGFAKPIRVEAGETIRMQCSWDRSLDPNRPPKYIVFAEGTEDEMCFSTYALIPDSP